ncbi:RNA polymerase sigma factor [Akkermansiaceae bacterium]|nr:RNA polymerase sigma factor [Akkermansiaceae bacterium]
MVGRYGNLVHMAARRTCGDGALAADASQLVFILLARKAPSLVNHASLAGWLHVTSVRTTRDLIDKRRRESRKLERFQSVMEPNADTPDESWREIQPVLDSALAELGDKDREALLLRFYRALSVREVAGMLDITTAAAQKRIDRATERLREKLVRRGSRAGGTLAGVLAAGFASDAQAAIPAAQGIAAKAISSTTTGGAFFPAAIAMKATSPLIPAGVLVAGGIWLATQLVSISQLEESNARMASQLAKGPAGAVPNLLAPVKITTALDSIPVDWAEVARQLRASVRSGGLDPYPRLQERFSAMDLDQINAALDEIATVRLGKDDRELLEERFGEEIYLKGGARMALERFLPVMHTGNWKWTMGRYFKKWMDANQEEALPWLAENVGKMKSLSYGFFEESFHPFLASSPGTASRLLEVIPPKRRLEALRSLSNRAMPEASQIAWADAVRKHAPEAITWPIMNWSDGDGAPFTMAEVSGYMERINASKGERKACIFAAGWAGSAGDQSDRGWERKLPDWIIRFREWAAGIEPEIVEEATGLALAGGYSVSQENYGLALKYHRSSGDDKILLPLLDRDPTDEELPLARELAEHLTDGALREKYLKKFK